MSSLLDRIKAEEIKAALLAAIPSDLSPQASLTRLKLDAASA